MRARSTMLKLALVILSTVAVALAQAGPYAQCGGQNWAGATTCQAGCVIIRPSSLFAIFDKGECFMVQVDLHVLQSVLFSMSADFIECIHHAKQHFYSLHKDYCSYHHYQHRHHVHQI